MHKYVAIRWHSLHILVHPKSIDDKYENHDSKRFAT